MSPLQQRTGRRRQRPVAAGSRGGGGEPGGVSPRAPGGTGRKKVGGNLREREFWAGGSLLRGYRHGAALGPRRFRSFPAAGPPRGRERGWAAGSGAGPGWGAGPQPLLFSRLANPWISPSRKEPQEGDRHSPRCRRRPAWAPGRRRQREGPGWAQKFLLPRAGSGFRWGYLSPAGNGGLNSQMETAIARATPAPPPLTFLLPRFYTYNA